MRLPPLCFFAITTTTAMKKTCATHSPAQRFSVSTRPVGALRMTLVMASIGCLVQASTVQAQTHPLNDTGITFSGHAIDGNAATC